MKKNNRGFTLVELICVMVLVAIILVVAYPNFSKLTNLVQSRYDSNVRILAKTAAKMYVSNNKKEVDIYLGSNDKYCLPLAKLAAYDYLDPNLEDSSGEEINMKQCVNVTKEVSNGKTKYNYELSETDVVPDSTDYMPPILVLKKKEGATLDCKMVMNVSSKELFNSNCEVVARDNVSTNMQIDVNETINTSSIILKYSVSDEAGNKAIPIKIKLVTK